MDRAAEMGSRQNIGSDLHYRTGVKGRLARFVVAGRAAGDPVDATIVLPFLIFLIMMRLNELGRVDESFVLAGLTIPPFLAGAWMVIRLGYRGLGRAMLRGVLVGAIEAIALTVFIIEALSQPKAIELAVNLMIINFTFFWMGALLIGSSFDILTVTEEQYQKAAPLRAKIHWITRLVFGFEDIKGVPTHIGLLVVAIRFFGPILLAAWAVWTVGGSPWAVLKSILHLPIAG